MAKGEPGVADMVIMFDVDNTLLDNDRVRVLLERRLQEAIGAAASSRFWDIYEDVRLETELVNFPETVLRMTVEYPEEAAKSRDLLYAFPFVEWVYPASMRALEHAWSFATPVIVSDGDEVFQRYKIRAAGLEQAVRGNVLLYVHKEMSVDDVQRRFPAAHYVMVDDKPRIQAAMKAALGDRITTVMVCQGKYARDPAHHDLPPPDLEIEGIGGLLGIAADDLHAAAERRA